MIARPRTAFAYRLLLLLLCLCGSCLANAERVEDLPKPTNYVSDFAGVLSPQTQQALDALCAQVDRQAKAQIAVVTVKSLDGEPIENFATALEDKWKVGKKGTDRGIILLFAIQDRKWRIETGYGLEGILPDSKVGVIGRSIVPALEAGNYDSAISSAVVQVANVIAADAGVSLQNAPRRGPPQRQVKQISLGQLLVGGAVLLLLLILFARFAPSGTLGFLLGMFLGGGFGGGGGRGGGGGDGDGGGFGGFGGGSSGGGGASGDW
ncbi:Beta-propeller domains of methanol dehydrogenase type [Acidisarcina polymorpha]|uniref:Beta-propeller domains of methanol dehydrogenase type n=1 Tax=Acidisarcina polymorpha TaxID=2211140 RepID=A0A2Z5G737_9BACT|nr:TPM domain-containing protein [Acidisarcina polymorpha]AXC14485.1 Beta-propeller domains of methanol dehydrogenase type [Acidisarcina polymorpha]